MDSEDQNLPGTSGAGTSGEPVQAPTDDLASNQQTDEHLRLLRGFLEVPRRTTTASSKQNDWEVENDAETILRMEADSLRLKYLEKTDRMDKASDHLEALVRAEARNRTPAKLKIDIQPLVAQKDDPIFKQKWAKAVRAAESKLIGCLVEHLETIISSCNQELEEATTESLEKMRLTDFTAASKTIRETLQTANTERIKRNDQRKKRRLESRDDKERGKKKAKLNKEDS